MPASTKHPHRTPQNRLLNNLSTALSTEITPLDKPEQCAVPQNSPKTSNRLTRSYRASSKGKKKKKFYKKKETQQKPGRRIDDRERDAIRIEVRRQASGRQHRGRPLGETIGGERNYEARLARALIADDGDQAPRPAVVPGVARHSSVEIELRAGSSPPTVTQKQHLTQRR